jgi:hypothetical protein
MVTAPAATLTFAASQELEEGEMGWVRWRLAAAMTLVCARPALGADATCLWRHLPATVRQEVFAAYSREGRDGLDALNITDAEVSASLQACGVVPPTDAAGVRVVGAALVGVALQEASQSALADEGAVSVPQLSTAWAALGPAKRAALEEAVVQALHGGEPKGEPAGAILEDAIRRAGWDPSQAHAERVHQQLFDHFQGRAQQEAFSKLF